VREPFYTTVAALHVVTGKSGPHSIVNQILETLPTTVSP